MAQEHSLQTQLHFLSERISLANSCYNEAIRSDREFSVARQIKRKISLLEKELGRIREYLSKKQTQQ